mgnify:CR=1 FL=1
MAIRLDGKQTALKLREDVKQEVDKLREAGKRIPGLAVVLVGADPASQIYVRNKERALEKAGMKSFAHHLPAETTQEELLDLIRSLNENPEVDGILCQLPLPEGLDEELVIRTIDPEKDVDGFHPINAGRLLLGLDGLQPCTPAGVIYMLDQYEYDYEGKNALVIGRSNIVGKPMALMLLSKNCTVEVAHSRTKDLAQKVKEADLIVAAVGKLGLIDKSMVREDQWIVDVSINRTEDGKVRGDVVYDEVEPIVEALTPVPGGVGPMTIAMLMKNTLTAYYRHEEK